MKAPSHGRKQARTSRIDICRAFADRPFDDQFEEGGLRQPTSMSLKRGLMKNSFTPAELIQKLHIVSHTPLQAGSFLEVSAIIDEAKRLDTDLPAITRVHPAVMIKRKCQSNEPKQRQDPKTSLNQTFEAIRQPTDFATAALSRPKRRLGIIDSYKAISIQLTPRQKPLTSRNFYLKKSELLKKRDSKTNLSGTSRGYSIFGNQSMPLASTQPTDASVRPWQSKEAQELYI